MPIRILSAADVERALPMPLAIAAMRAAFSELSSGQAALPARSRITLPDGVTLFMPAYLARTQDLVVKAVSVMNGNAQVGLPAVQGAVMVLDPKTGAARALIDGRSLTAIRTGAGVGLAADLLATKQARTVAVFGAGAQARSNLAGVLAVRAIRTVCLIGRTWANVERLIDELRTADPQREVTWATAPEEAVAASDIVLAATAASTPLFDGRAVRPGTFVSAIGSHTATARELDEHIVRAAYRVIDAYVSAPEAGDFVLAGVAADAELGEVVNGDKPGRASGEQVTLFKSCGLAVQDAAAAGAALREAERLNLGILVPFDQGSQSGE